jgi:hypothetical protein
MRCIKRRPPELQAEFFQLGEGYVFVEVVLEELNDIHVWNWVLDTHADLSIFTRWE